MPDEAAELVEFLLSRGGAGYFSEETFEYPLADGRRGQRRAAAVRGDLQDPGRPRRAGRRPGGDHRDDRREWPHLKRSLRRFEVRWPRRTPHVRDGSPEPPRGRCVGVCAVVGLLFAAPLLYLVWRNVTGDEDLVDLYLSEATLVPLRNTLVLAVATGARPLRSWAPAWPGSRPAPTCRSGGCGRCSPRCRWCSRRSWARLALLAAVAPGGLLDEPLGWIGRRGHPPGGLLGRLAGAHPVHLPVRATAGGRPARGPAAVAGGERPAARAAARGRCSAPSCCRRSAAPSRPGALLVFLYTVSDFGVVRAAPLRHAHPGDLHQPAARPRPVGGAQPAAGGGRPGGGRGGADASPGATRGTLEGVRAARPLQVPLGRWRAAGAGGGARLGRAGARRPAGVARAVGVARPHRRDQQPRVRRPGAGRPGGAGAQHGGHQPRHRGRGGRRPAPARLPVGPPPGPGRRPGQRAGRDRVRPAGPGDRAGAGVLEPPAARGVGPLPELHDAGVRLRRALRRPGDAGRPGGGRRRCPAAWTSGPHARRRPAPPVRDRRAAADAARARCRRRPGAAVDDEGAAGHAARRRLGFETLATRIWADAEAASSPRPAWPAWCWSPCRAC